MRTHCLEKRGDVIHLMEWAQERGPKPATLGAAMPPLGAHVTAGAKQPSAMPPNPEILCIRKNKVN